MVSLDTHIKDIISLDTCFLVESSPLMAFYLHNTPSHAYLSWDENACLSHEDYIEVLSLVVKFKAIRETLSIAANSNKELERLNVKTIFKRPYIWNSPKVLKPSKRETWFACLRNFFMALSRLLGSGTRS